MKTKILVVDDEPDVRDYLKKRLEGRGYIVETAADGDEGLEAARQHVPDLILLDVLMPNKDGFSMLQELQADPALRRITVIMATAKSQTKDIYYGQDLGATDYLIKPIDFDVLLKYIRKYANTDETA
ncbi:MAG TPA: response regulator [Candidatus Omnitrophota bacterium]|nr:response regulator [Candidatus Omnitrophota bacterium]HQO38579.1 response regulator [Candidatus Omnitrophota bacterium]HQQ06174.1 response regulator [Candidatus Omnitrophota bacterium]